MPFTYKMKTLVVLKDENLIEWTSLSTFLSKVKNLKFTNFGIASKRAFLLLSVMLGFNCSSLADAVPFIALV